MATTVDVGGIRFAFDRAANEWKGGNAGIARYFNYLILEDSINNPFRHNPFPEAAAVELVKSHAKKLNVSFKVVKQEPAPKIEKGAIY